MHTYPYEALRKLSNQDDGTQRDVEFPLLTVVQEIYYFPLHVHILHHLNELVPLILHVITNPQN